MKTLKPHNYQVGQRIKFKKEVRTYKIVGVTPRYLVCLKSFRVRPQYRYLYTIVDLQEKERGPDHWLLGKYDYEDAEDLALALQELESGECKLSPRRSIKLDLEYVK